MTTSQVADQQILRGAAGTLSWQHLDADGEPADPGTTTVGVARADGTVLVAPGTATTVAGTVRTFSLTPSQTAAMDVLAVTWTAGGVAYPTVVEIVGGYYFTVAQARGSDSALANDSKYPTVDLLGHRRDVEDEFEEICEVAFVPRYRRQRVDGSGGACLVLPMARPRRIVAISDVAPDGTTTAWSGAEVTAVRLDPEGSGEITSPIRAFPWEPLSVIVAWEHGHDRPPPEVRKAALRRVRYNATSANSAIPDRATSFSVAEGGVYRLDTARRTHTGIPDVDAVLDRWSMATPGLA